MHTFFSPLSLRSWPLLPCAMEWSCGSARTGHMECSATVCGDNGHSVTRAYTGPAHGIPVEWQCWVALTEIFRISKCENSYKLTGLWKGHVVASMINTRNSRAVMKVGSNWWLHASHGQFWAVETAHLPTPEHVVWAICSKSLSPASCHLQYNKSFP